MGCLLLEMKARFASPTVRSSKPQIKSAAAKDLGKDLQLILTQVWQRPRKGLETEPVMCVWDISIWPLKSGRLDITGYDQDLLMLLTLQIQSWWELCCTVCPRAQPAEFTLSRQELIKASFKPLLCFELMHSSDSNVESHSSDSHTGIKQN